MREVGAGRIALDTPVVELLPEFEGSDRARVTIRQLLSHCSGLPAHRPFWRQAAEAPSGAPGDLAAGRTRAAGIRARHDVGVFRPRVHRTRLAAGTRDRRALDVLAHKQIAAPLALAATTFMSLSDPEARARVLGRSIDRGDAGLFGTAARADRRGSTTQRDGDGRRRGARGPVLDGRGAVTDRGWRSVAPGAGTTRAGASAGRSRRD
jgi:CubicO group peptidase (beta-lactamase class C family)